MVSSNDVQRLFLQAVISRGTLSAKLAQILWVKCAQAIKVANNTVEIPDTANPATWNAIVEKINNSLNVLDLEFRHLHEEATGREMYALVNRKGDEIAQMATDYSPVEIAYFKAIVEQIMLAPNESYSVSSMAALREVTTLKTNMSKTQGEVVLRSFVANGWLLRSQRGRYSLSTRTILELLPYLKSTYADEIIECTICMEILTRGIACYTTNCKTRMHFHCFSTYRRRHAACPTCSKEWPGDARSKPLIPVGEDAVKNGQEDGKRRVRRKSADSGSEEEEDEPDGDEEETQPKVGRKGKGKEKDTSMDVDEDDANEPTPPKRSQPTRSRRARK